MAAGLSRYLCPALAATSTVAAVLTLCAVTAGDAGGHTSATMPVVGVVELHVHYQDPIPGHACQVDDAYPDLRFGAEVVIRDRYAMLAGFGTLNPGIVTVLSPASQACVFTFTVQNVSPADGPWTFEIVHRGRLPFTQTQAADLKMRVGK